ncbi:probable cytochrome P450 6a14 [Homalodisca vitripennis]|uniref:probable cytochrome P450 6a14 n=1 Tax=Homalodisca vitripennis TaxID=197043 RepID=UPI001EE9EA61|nr:probable cytochrome P450 6a14 [Homalodisca vitripennis]
MSVLLESVTTEILCFFLLLLWLIYWYLTKNYDYWDRRGVPNIKPQFPFGSMRETMLSKTFFGKAHDNFYNQFPNKRFYGIVEFRRPVLVLKDPELIKRIMVKDFQSFVDRPVIMGNPKEYIMLHLLNLMGRDWKDMRTKLTPTFTSGKMKTMFALMEKCSEELRDHLETEVEKGKTIDAKHVLARFTMDIIASCAFGLDTDCLTDENSEVFKIFGGVAKTSKSRFIRRVFILIFPSVLKFLRVNLIRPELRNFVTNIVRATIDYRIKNNIKRNDFIDLMIGLRKQEEIDSKQTSDVSYGLTIEQMTAQSFVFFIAGFETASSLMSFCLYELSRHQQVQEQLYQDIQGVVDSNGGKISYQVLMEIPFLDQVLNETLRLYGSAHVLSRVCTQPYQVPDSDLIIEKGMQVVIPLFSLHHDPQYYPDPYAFKPERFTVEETKKRHPYVFMPFGEGPRNCIGMRFGLMQAKVGLATIILNFHVDLSPDQEVPIEIDKRSLALMPANPVLLNFNKRKIT